MCKVILGVLLGFPVLRGPDCPRVLRKTATSYEIFADHNISNAFIMVLSLDFNF
jgi:hypothetical protein